MTLSFLFAKSGKKSCRSGNQETLAVASPRLPDWRPWTNQTSRELTLPPVQGSAPQPCRPWPALRRVPWTLGQGVPCAEPASESDRPPGKRCSPASPAPPRPASRSRACSFARGLRVRGDRRSAARRHPRASAEPSSALGTARAPRGRLRVDRRGLPRTRPGAVAAGHSALACASLMAHLRAVLRAGAAGARGDRTARAGPPDREKERDSLLYVRAGGAEAECHSVAVGCQAHAPRCANRSRFRGRRNRALHRVKALRCANRVARGDARCARSCETTFPGNAAGSLITIGSEILAHLHCEESRDGFFPSLSDSLCPSAGWFFISWLS